MLIISLGELCNFSSSCDRYFVCECFFLRLHIRKLSRYLVHWKKCKHICFRQYNLWTNRLCASLLLSCSVIYHSNFDILQISSDLAQRECLDNIVKKVASNFSKRWFENVTLANRACGGGIAAWKGTNITDAPGNRYGAYISKSRIVRVRFSLIHLLKKLFVHTLIFDMESPDANASLDITDSCFLGRLRCGVMTIRFLCRPPKSLGRPWNDLATTVYLETYMDDTINSAGWTAFDSARYEHIVYT